MTSRRIPPCWKTSELGRVLALDAGQYLDDLAPFMAVHLPLPGHEYERGRMYLQPELGKPVEDVAASAFATLTRDDGDDQSLVVPVVGEPGSGKSHLVRWCYHRLQQQRLSGDTRFLPVYIPRQRASFKGMVEAIEEAIDVQGDKASQAVVKSLRSRVTRLTDMRPVEVARLVIADMTNRLDRVAAEGGTDSDTARNLFDVVREGGQVGDLLTSDTFPVGRRASILLGVTSAEDEHDPGWTTEDLVTLSSSARGTQAFAAAIRKVARTDRPEARDAACVLLNRVLDEAMASQLQAESDGSTVTLSDAFRQLRRALEKAGSELVILVEDVVTFQGLERTLLDAFIEPPDAEVCRLRALVASTGGHWSRLIDDIGTLENRLGPTYGLALQQTDASQSRALLTRLAGSYLNAARTGAKELQAEYAAVPDAERNAWVAPSVCVPCKYRARCHDAFGTATPRSEFDVGLFPLNEQALHRAYAVAAHKARLEREGVNPRLLVRNVLFPVLSEAPSIKDGSFPSLSIKDAFSTPAEFADMRTGLLKPALSDDERDRAALALELWGADDNGSRVISDEIALAFGLPAVPGVSASAPGEEEQEEPSDDAPTRRRTPPIISAIKDWMNTGVMTQAHANAVRGLVFQACLSRVPWSELAGESPSSTADAGIARELGLRTHEHSVSIPLENQTADRPAEHTLVAGITRDAEGYLLLQSLAQLNLSRDDEHLDGRALLCVAEAVEPLVDGIIAHARLAGYSREDDIVAEGPTPRALLATSLLAGCMSAAPAGTVGLAKALLAPDPPRNEDSPLASIVRTALEGVRLPQSEAVGGLRFSRETAREWLLRRVVIRQSIAPTAGEVPRIIDAGRLLPLVRSLEANGAHLEPAGALLENRPTSDPGEAALRLLQEVEGSALDSALKPLQQRWAEVRRRADEFGVASNSPDQWVEALHACMRAAVSMVQELRAVGKEPDGTAYAVAKELLVPSDSPLRHALTPSQRADTETVFAFGLKLGDLDTAAIDDLAALGSYAAAAHTLGKAIVDLHDNLAPAVENARTLLEGAMQSENPILASFDGEFEEALARVRDALDDTH